MGSARAYRDCSSRCGVGPHRAQAQAEGAFHLLRRCHTGHSLLWRARCCRSFDEMPGSMCQARHGPFCCRSGNIEATGQSNDPLITQGSQGEGNC